VDITGSPYGGNFTNVIYTSTGNYFIATGTLGAVYYSHDGGLSWLNGISRGYASTFYATLFGNSKFINAGNGVSSGLQYSSDGTTWINSGTTYNKDFSGIGIGILSGSPFYITVGSTGYTYGSSNGISWTSQGQAGSAILNGCTYGSLWVIVGESGSIYTSPDTAISWTQRTASSSFTGHFYAATYGVGIYVIVGASGEIQTSPDGVTWTHQTAGSSYSGSFYGVTYLNGIFVAVGSNGEIQTSLDGFTWTQRTKAGSYTGDFRGISFGNGVWLIAGSTGEIQTSNDAITWTHRACANSYSGTFYGASFGNNIHVLVGDGGEIQNTLNPGL
jgi:hypothetical protein